MITEELEVSLRKAFDEAEQQRHEFITVEHLLLALLDNPSVSEVLHACSANIEDLRKELSEFIKNTPTLVAGTDDFKPQPTLGFKHVIQRAILHVQSAGNGKTGARGADALLAIFGEKDSKAVYFLHQQGVMRSYVVSFITDGTLTTPPTAYMATKGEEEVLLSKLSSDDDRKLVKEFFTKHSCA